jgi:hypothetical protein
MEESAVFAVALVGFAFAIVSRRIEAGPLSAPIIFTATWGVEAYKNGWRKAARTTERGRLPRRCGTVDISS